MMKRAIEEFKPLRVAVDSLSALERVSSERGFREFIIGLTSFVKHQETAGLFTATRGTLLAPAFKNVSGILAGTPTTQEPPELQRVAGLFEEQDPDA